MSREEQLEKKMCLAFFAKSREKYPQLGFQELIEKSMEMYKAYMEKHPEKKGKIAIYDYNIVRYNAEDMYYKLHDIKAESSFEDKAKEITETTKLPDKEAMAIIAEMLFDKNNLYDALLEKSKRLNDAYKELKETYKEKMEKAGKLNKAYKALKAKYVK